MSCQAEWFFLVRRVIYAIRRAIPERLFFLWLPFEIFPQPQTKKATLFIEGGLPLNVGKNVVYKGYCC